MNTAQGDPRCLTLRDVTSYFLTLSEQLGWCQDKVLRPRNPPDYSLIEGKCEFQQGMLFGSPNRFF